MQEWRLNDWVVHWVDLYKRVLLKPSTFDSYKEYCKHVTCDKPLRELCTDDIQLMINEMVIAGASTSTIKHMLVVTRQSLKKAYALHLIDSLSCMDGLELPRAVSERIEGLEDYQVDEILKNSHRSYYGDLFRCLLFSGMRVGEMLALTWGDVNLIGRYIFVQNTSYNRQLVRVKTNNSRRRLPLSGEFYDILERKYKRFPRRTGDFVFTNTRGEPVLYHSLLSAWHAFLKRIGIEETFGLHVLRHTFAHRALRAGVPIKVVSAWLGHGSINITLQIYDHVDKQDFRNASQIIADMYASGSSSARRLERISDFL